MKWYTLCVVLLVWSNFADSLPMSRSRSVVGRTFFISSFSTRLSAFKPMPIHNRARSHERLKRIQALAVTVTKTPTLTNNAKVVPQVVISPTTQTSRFLDPPGIEPFLNWSTLYAIAEAIVYITPWLAFALYLSQQGLYDLRKPSSNPRNADRNKRR